MQFFLNLKVGYALYTGVSYSPVFKVYPDWGFIKSIIHSCYCFHKCGWACAHPGPRVNPPQGCHQNHLKYLTWKHVLWWLQSQWFTVKEVGRTQACWTCKIKESRPTWKIQAEASHAHLSVWTSSSHLWLHIHSPAPSSRPQPAGLPCLWTDSHYGQDPQKTRL